MSATAPHLPTAASRRGRRLTSSIDRMMRRRNDRRPGVDRNAPPSEIAWRTINEITPRA